MRRALPWLAPLALAPLLGLGWLLWRDQAAAIMVSGFFSSCF